MARLTSKFYNRPTLEAAEKMIGKYLVRKLNGELLICRITEAEAYIGAIDKACHAYGGRRTSRTEVLYAAPGTVYVYLVYGMYHCLNFVTEEKDVAAAVLIRGGTAAAGSDTMARNRYGKPLQALTAREKKNLLNGPGKLCRALAITREENSLPCNNDQLWLCDSLPELGLSACTPKIAVGTRIGIDYAEEAAAFPWRFYETTN